MLLRRVSPVALAFIVLSAAVGGPAQPRLHAQSAAPAAVAPTSTVPTSTAAPDTAVDAAVPVYAAEPIERWRAQRLSREQVRARAVERSFDVQRARIELDQARQDLARTDGRNDVILRSELTGSRARSPVNVGLTRGVQSAWDLQLESGVTRRFDTGTTLNLTWQTGVQRSEIPIRIEGFADRIVTGPDSRNALTLSVQQNLLRGRGVEAGQAIVSVAEHQVRLRELAVLRAENAAAADAMSRYTGLVLAVEELALQRRTVERSELQIRIAEARLAAGQIAPFEMNLVRQRYVAAHEAVLVATLTLRRQSRELAVRVGFGPSEPLLLPTERLLPTAPLPDDDTLCVAAAWGSPDALLLSEQVSLAVSSLAPAQDARRAQLDLIAGVTSAGLDPSFATSFGRMITFDAVTMFSTLSFSTAVGNRAARAEFERAVLDVEAARRELERFRDEVCFLVLDAVDAVRAQDQRAAFADYRVRVARDALTAEEARFERGLVVRGQGLNEFLRLRGIGLEDERNGIFALLFELRVRGIEPGPLVNAARGRKVDTFWLLVLSQ